MQPTKAQQTGSEEKIEVLQAAYRPRLKPVCAAKLNDESARDIFKAYFNNKMTVILLLLQKRRVEPDSYSSLRAVLFFDDLYHHMLPSEYQRDYGKAFKWLRLFFKRFPYVKVSQRKKALVYMQIVYQLFGMELKLKF